MSIGVFGGWCFVAAALLAGAAAAQPMPQQMTLPPGTSAPGFGAPLSTPAQAEAEAPAPAAQAAPAKPKPAAKPVPTVTLTNGSASTATEVVLSSGEMTAKLGKPLASKAKASLRLPKLKGCTVSVAASFEGEGQVDVGEFDICKDKSIRFTD